MRGLLYCTEDEADRLADDDLYTLSDSLAVMLHNAIGVRVFLLHRADIADLIADYICDLDADDQATIVWMVWHLFQAARDIALSDRRR